MWARIAVFKGKASLAKQGEGNLIEGNKRQHEAGEHVAEGKSSYGVELPAENDCR